MICLVVLCHNRYFYSYYPQLYHYIYSFHVACFFVLPFFYNNDIRFFSMSRVWVYCKRLLWPYTYMFVFLYFMSSVVTNDYNLEWGLINTFLTGNFYSIHKYIGFQYLWFLPAMFSMLVIKDIYTSRPVSRKILMLSIGAVFYVLCWAFLINQPFSTSISEKIASFSFFSFMLGWAMLFIGICTRKMILNSNISTTILVLITCLTLFSLVIISREYPYNLYARWIARTINPIIIFIILYKTPMFNMKVLQTIGKLSLPIYLFHQPINYSVCSLIESWGGAESASNIVSFSDVNNVYNCKMYYKF